MKFATLLSLNKKKLRRKKKYRYKIKFIGRGKGKKNRTKIIDYSGVALRANLGPSSP